MLWKKLAALQALALFAALLSMEALSLTPFPRPEPAEGILPGDPSPFVGEWSMTLPTMEMGTPDADHATCATPVRIEAASEEHVYYYGPDQADLDPAIKLSAREGGTYWEPVAGGPHYFTIWIEADMFYLYDGIPQTEADWGRPFVYRRCPQP
jgi:hypothetical protein